MAGLFLAVAVVLTRQTDFPGQLRAHLGRVYALFGPTNATARPPTGEIREFLCPITYTVMSDPVMAADGRSYERAAIQKWLDDHPGAVNSPMSGAPLASRELRPNLTLRGAIAEWAQQQTCAGED